MTRRPFAHPAVCLGLAGFLIATTVPADESIPCGAEEPPSPASVAPESSKSLSSGVGRAVLAEAKLYLEDAGALVTSPLHWDSRDARTAIGFAGALGTLLLADHAIDEAMQRSRSHFTDQVSKATSDFGGTYAWVISGGLLLGGLIAKDTSARDTGREALEAAVLSGLLTNLFKESFGRERPIVSNGRTDFDPFSGNKSFPSGHATTAFAVASVVAMRTEGWVVPSVAYALATIVAMDRLNDRAHFASDVFAGAAVGMATGRFLVNRHRRQATERPHAELEIVPIRDGLAARVTF